MTDSTSVALVTTGIDDDLTATGAITPSPYLWFDGAVIQLHRRSGNNAPAPRWRSGWTTKSNGFLLK